jgi:hypothetical protein
MWLSLTACIIFALSLQCVLASRSEIKSLPGWDGKIIILLLLPFSQVDALPSKMYSGFIYSGVSNTFPTGSMYMHYWFVESEGNPTTDPTIYWFNGM